MLDCKIRVSYSEPTASVSINDLGVNPDYWNTLKHVGKKTLLVHEALHIVLGHLDTWYPALDHFASNVAMDAVNNRIISLDPTLSLDSLVGGVVRVSGDTLYIPCSGPDQFKKLIIPGLEKMDWFSIYLQIKNQLEDDQDPGLSSYVRLPRSSQEAKEARKKVSTILSNSKLVGDHGTSTVLEKQWKELHNKKLDWRKLLQSMIVTELGLDEYGTKPNTRTQHLYYSTRRTKTAYPNISVLIDTSGSINRDELSLFIAFVNQLLVELQVSTQLIVFDQEVVSNVLVTPPFKITPDSLYVYGHRGTDFRPAFDAVRGSSELILIFTDLCGKFPAQAPRQKVIWLSTVDKSAPWGRVVHLTT